MVAGLGLPEREPRSRLFGNWTWDYSDVPDEVWIGVQPILKERITKLYYQGLIRYGSW